MKPSSWMTAIENLKPMLFFVQTCNILFVKLTFGFFFFLRTFLVTMGTNKKLAKATPAFMSLHHNLPMCQTKNCLCRSSLAACKCCSQCCLKLHCVASGAGCDTAGNVQFVGYSVHLWWRMWLLVVGDRVKQWRHVLSVTKDVPKSQTSPRKGHLTRSSVIEFERMTPEEKETFIRFFSFRIEV